MKSLKILVVAIFAMLYGCSQSEISDDLLRPNVQSMQSGVIINSRLAAWDSFSEDLRTCIEKKDMENAHVSMKKWFPNADSILVIQYSSGYLEGRVHSKKKECSSTFSSKNMSKQEMDEFKKGIVRSRDEGAEIFRYMLK